MTDMFRGYDLTSVVEKVTRQHYESLREALLSRAVDGDREVPTWEELTPFTKQQMKSNLLPIITDVLEALESEDVKPTEAKTMYAYGYENSNVSGADPRFYENVDIMHSLDTCTVWALHLHAHPSVLDAMLERASALPETTGEYTYGDSWTEWGEETDDDADRHLTIYFDATPARAKEIGDHIANHLTVAGVRALGDDSGSIPAHAISTSGDYAEQLPE